jgi:hypothetical protein
MNTLGEDRGQQEGHLPRRQRIEGSRLTGRRVRRFIGISHGMGRTGLTARKPDPSRFAQFQVFRTMAFIRKCRPAALFDIPSATNATKRSRKSSE